MDEVNKDLVVLDFGFLISRRSWLIDRFRDFLNEGTMLISHEGVKCVRVVGILVQLVEPVVDVKVGFRLRLVLRWRSVC